MREGAARGNALDPGSFDGDKHFRYSVRRSAC
jgi:hypothetical protein